MAAFLILQVRTVALRLSQTSHKWLIVAELAVHVVKPVTAGVEGGHTSGCCVLWRNYLVPGGGASDTIVILLHILR